MMMNNWKKEQKTQQNKQSGNLAKGRHKLRERRTISKTPTMSNIFISVISHPTHWSYSLITRKEKNDN